jgi:hypothetical protein
MAMILYNKLWLPAVHTPFVTKTAAGPMNAAF